MERKKKIILYGTIFLIVFLLSTTNTFWMINSLLVFLFSLLIIFLLSLITDRIFQTNFKRTSLSIFVVSVFGVISGFLTFPIQEKWNQNKAAEFISKIEKFQNQNNRFPIAGGEIQIPSSRYGLYSQKFEYYFPNRDDDEYIVKYFDGFWDTKVYVSNQKKWYTDD